VVDLNKDQADVLRGDELEAHEAQWHERQGADKR